ncbi:MAG: EF-P lysine aminoacylase EpmA [Gammaproteobacteria bacterium]|nr:EF-P lysine aminoacylase EpmA [Gammaproteobacteria bacterium]
MTSLLTKSLKEKSELIKKIRAFFYERGVIEVTTPALVASPITDVHIDSISVRVNEDIGKADTLYLHTSPEIEMKRLLAQGSGDIFQICSVYRDNEHGERNFNEFSMLEYYRLDFDMHQLMDEVAELVALLGYTHPVIKLSYNEAYIRYAGIDILQTDFETLKAFAKSHGLSTDFQWIGDLQMLLFVHFVEPKLRQHPVCFIFDYPKQQAALAQVDGNVAHRFEMYLEGVEVANGYQEIQTAEDYRDRFEAELAKRQALGKPAMALDECFLSDLSSPLPFCSGVAIGMGRLLENLV